MPSHSRRAALAAFLGGIASIDAANGKKKRKKNKDKKKYRCKSGPCDYGSCLTYVDAEAARHPANAGNTARANSAKKDCCGGCSSLGCSSGREFHDQAVSCVATWFA